MSYLVGKRIFAERQRIGFVGVDLNDLNKEDVLFVRYYKESDMFVFKFRKMGVVCKCPREDAVKLIGFNDIYHKTPPGFEYNKIMKKGRELHDEFIYEISNGGCGSEEFFIISVLCYFYCLNETFLDKVFCRRGGGYLTCAKRSEVKKGRKVGTKMRDKKCVDSEEALERKAWNQEVAVRKGMLGLFVEAEKEYCKEVGISFNLEACEKEFKKRVDFEWPMRV